MNAVQLLTLDPGHFHAALVQKEMVAGVDRRVHVYAPLGPDLIGHLARIAGFNGRAENPTAWELEVHAGPDFLERMLRDRPGNVVVLAGRNAQKIDYIEAAVAAGLHVLADKPWIIVPEHLPKLQAILDQAGARGLVAYDIMTERFEITSILQRALVHDAETFGALLPGTEAEPGVLLESVHYLKKLVAGAPLRRPPWFFDIRQQGEGLSDVGTHLVDLATWIMFPDQAIDHQKDIAILSGKRWPTSLTRADFEAITGEPKFPAYLAAAVQGDRLDYFCNNQVRYTVRGVHIRLDALWDFEAAPGAGDTHRAVFQGTRARIEVRQGKEENFTPELYVVPQLPGDLPAVAAALRCKVDRLQAAFPGVAVEEVSDRLRVRIPDRYRTGHEAHFALVARLFLSYLAKPQALPAWEKPNMLAKYFVSTEGTRRGG